MSYPYVNLAFTRFLLARHYLVVAAIVIAALQILAFLGLSDNSKNVFIWFNLIFEGLFALLALYIALKSINTRELQQMFNDKADFEKILLDQITQIADIGSSDSTKKIMTQYLASLKPDKEVSKQHLSALPQNTRKALLACCQEMIAAKKAETVACLTDDFLKVHAIAGEAIISQGQAIQELEDIESLLGQTQ